MKKAFVLFIGIFLLGLAGICVLPGYILKEAENVTLSEQEREPFFHWSTKACEPWGELPIKVSWP